MIEDVIDNFRNSTPAANQKFVREVNLTQIPEIPVTGCYTRKFDVNQVFSGYTTLLPNIWVCSVKNAKLNKYLPDRLIFKNWYVNNVFSGQAILLSNV